MVIGITGSIATGKSLISNRIKELGYQLIDLDCLSHNAFEKDEVKEQISESLNIEKEEITRKRVGEIVFNDKNKLEILESILYPYVFNEMDEIIKKCSDKLVFVDAPLLFEKKLEKRFHKIILVYLKEELELIRLMKRDNINDMEAKKRISLQMPIDEKKKMVINLNGYIIDNCKEIEDSYLQLDNILKELNNEN